MDGLTLFGLAAVSAMLVSYALEARSRWWILVFAGSCVAGSAYGFLQGAWPFGLVEGIWSIVQRGAGGWRAATRRHARSVDLRPPPPYRRASLHGCQDRLADSGRLFAHGDD